MDTAYIQVSQPDFERIAEIITAIKGPNRTMAKLAEACHVSASTLSRLVNGKSGKPASLELLQKLYEQKDASCTFEFEELIKANGMVKRLPKSAEEEAEKRHSAFRERMARSDAMRDQIKNGLLDRGIQIGFDGHARHSIPQRDDEVLSESFALLFGVERYGTPDMILKTIHGENNFFWGFEFVPTLLDDMPSRFPGRESLAALDYAWRVIQHNSVMFLDSALDLGISKLAKVSFVFVDEQIFGCFCTVLKQFKLRANVSAILLDVKKGSILQERNLSASGGDPATDLFALNVVVDEQDCHHDEFGDALQRRVERYRQLSFLDDL